MERTYIAIDLKSFYASVECVERGLDPLKTNLVVADSSRTEKTICLAVSPSLKAYGISGRARLFEVVQQVSNVNSSRRSRAPQHRFTGKSCNADELRADNSLELDYIVAPPQMAHYMEFSTKIYGIYLRYVAPEDISVYSIDEVFIDATHYLSVNRMTAREFAMTIIHDVLSSTGITATAGIAPNLFLCKVAMDIKAKHIPPDRDGVRIAELDEESFRREFWGHKPLTDFWRIGKGIAKKLAANGMDTLGDVARCSVVNEELLYKLFGINAELLIDHAWGWEPCTIAEIKAFKPENNSLSSGQVLQSPYEPDKARIVVLEMAEAMALDLVKKCLATNQLTLMIGYDIENLKDARRREAYKGAVTDDRYGRSVPKMSNGSINIKYGSSTKRICEAIGSLYDEITDTTLLVRRMYVGANHVIPESDIPPETDMQLDLFSDSGQPDDDSGTERERRLQETTIAIHDKYGKNALLNGRSFRDGATGRDRNKQIGGHKA